MVRVAAIDVLDDPRSWAACGFTVDADGTVAVGSVAVRITPPATDTGVPGAAGWELAGLDGPVPDGHIDGVPTTVTDADPPTAEAHANGTVGIDHVVVVTPDVERTVAAVEELGIPLKRRRRGESMGRPVQQAFFRLGEVILEVAGPPDPDPGTQSEPAAIWGLAFTVSDLESTAACLGDRLSPPRDAVQRGRRIASVRRAAGLAVPVAFLTPEPR